MPDTRHVGLQPRTGTLEAFATSVSTMAPTLAMAFAVSLVAKATAFVPLAFLMGGVAIAVVAYSFTAFSREVVGAGSAMSFVETVLGRRSAVLTGWIMLLGYVTFAAGSYGMVGNFLAAAVAHAWIAPAFPVWFGVALLMGAVVPALTLRPLSTISHLALGLEVLSVCAILWLAAVIVLHAPASAGALHPTSVHGFVSVGAGVTPALLAFAGFEAATTVSEETRGATRAVPRAVILSVALVTTFFILVSYAQLIGFVRGGPAALAGSPAPLDALSSRFISGGFGAFLDVCAAVSAFAGALSSTTGASRLLYALSGQGLGEALRRLDPQNGTPKRAIIAVCLANAVLLIAFGALGADGFVGLLLTVGVLALILVYLAVCASQTLRAAGRRTWLGVGLGALGCALLLWPLYTSVDLSGALTTTIAPLTVVAWMAAGGVWLVLRDRPIGRTADPR